MGKKFEELHETGRKIGEAIEPVVVDDGPTDDTSCSLEEEGQQT